MLSQQHVLAAHWQLPLATCAAWICASAMRKLGQPGERRLRSGLMYPLSTSVFRWGILITKAMSTASYTSLHDVHRVSAWTRVLQAAGEQ